MKTNRVWGTAAGVVLALFLVTAPRAFAILGAGDTTIMVGDLTDVWKWPRELEQWTSLINNTTEQINKADALIRLAGNPRELAGQVLATVADVTKPADDAVGLQNREDALAFGKALYGLGSATARTINDANHVTDQYQGFGKTFQRDPKRYEQYAEEQALYERFKTAADNERKVMTAEMQLQHTTLEKMRNAQTQTEIELLKAQMAASKQRQDLAHQMTEQARGELEAFQGECRYEDMRKQEADREWAETMVSEMRARALASYNAQVNAGGSSAN